ncbi:hypothetical protein JTP67_32840, partial [Streptomyces sp. S12]|nr:hypothetical protein [Streptomyces sp. S12]
DRIETVASKEQVKHHSVADPTRKEAIDEAMSAKFERNPVRIGPTPGNEPSIVAGGRSQNGDIDNTFARMVQAARDGRADDF